MTGENNMELRLDLISKRDLELIYSEDATFLEGETNALDYDDDMAIELQF
jgi:uncharacterized protein YfaS (alpha-2-macroglobulin family)